MAGNIYPKRGNSNKKTLLIIGAGEEQKLAVKTAKEIGLFVVVSDINPNAPAIELANDYIQASTYDPKETLKAALKFSRSRKIDGVMTVGVDAPQTVSLVAQKLGLNAHSMITAKLATNKLLMKEAFKREGVNIPWFSKVDNLKHLKSIVSKKGRRLVLKPQDSRGGRGVLQLDKVPSLEWAYEIARNYSPSQQVMIEEFLPGPQISTESFIYQGKIYTPGFIDRNYELLRKFSPYFIENGGEQPTKLSPNIVTKVNFLLEKAAKAMKIKEGVMKGDIVVHKQEPAVIEVAARLSGGYMATKQIPIATNVDLVKAVIKSALNIPINPSELLPKFQKGVAIRYWFPKSGSIVKVTGVDKLKNYPWIKYYYLKAKLGDSLERPTDLTKRIGFVICEGKNRQQAVERNRKIINLVKIKTL